MPPGSRNISQDFLHSWEAFDRTFAAQPSSPSSEEEDSESLNLRQHPRHRPMAPEPFSTPYGSHASTSSSGPMTPGDSEPMDRVWGAVRKAKEREMAASPFKDQVPGEGQISPDSAFAVQRRAPGTVSAVGRAGALSSTSFEETAIDVSSLHPIYMRASSYDTTTFLRVVWSSRSPPMAPG